MVPSALATPVAFSLSVLKSRIPPSASEIKDIEHEADRVIIEVYQELNRTFVTPIDRSDIYRLGSELEGITDAIYSTVLQIDLHAMVDLPGGSKEVARLIYGACGDILEAVTCLQGNKSHLDIRVDMSAHS